VVDPHCDILSDNAKALASGSVEILENAKIFPTLKECVADLHRVFATTVRPRRKFLMS
jgi:tRNA/rRNA methyltransferase